MADEKTKRAFIISDFKDAGTEEVFTKGDIRTIDAGTFANYEAAGLVRAPTADDGKATKPAA